MNNFVKSGHIFACAIFFMFACEKENIAPDVTDEVAHSMSETNSKKHTNARSAASLGRIGSEADVSRSTSGGTVLMGGGTDVDEAIMWMINRSG